MRQTAAVMAEADRLSPRSNTRRKQRAARRLLSGTLLICITACGPAMSAAQEPAAGEPLSGSHSAEELHEAYRILKAAGPSAERDRAAAEQALFDLRMAADDARRTLARLKRARPVLPRLKPNRDWETLSIGEFEPDEAFDKRVAAAKAAAVADLEEKEREAKLALPARIAEWNNRVERAEEQAEAAKAKLERQEAEAEARVEDAKRAEWVRPQLPEYRMWVAASDDALPRFDRDEMAFADIPILSDQRLYLPDRDEDDGILEDAWISYEDTLRVGVRCDGLAEAKQFKEDVQAGRIIYMVCGDLLIEEAESPVVLQERVMTVRRRVEEKSVVGGVLGAAAAAALLIASGSDGTGPNDQMVMNSMVELGAGEREVKTERIELRPEVTIRGTRLNLAFRPTYVVVARRSEGEVAAAVGVKAKPLSPGVEVTRVLETAQGVIRRGVKKGDLVLAIDDRYVHSPEALAAAIRGVEAGKSFSIMVRRGPEGGLLEGGVIGGQPLGLAVRSSPAADE